MSPRRSSRARSSALPPTTTSHVTSSNGKIDRGSRPSHNGHNRAISPRRTSTVRSESNEDLELGSRTAESTIAPRRSRRGNDGDSSRDKNTVSQANGGEDDEEVAIEEDVTRCICGQPDYPGPGDSVREQLTFTFNLSDEVGNFFVQCDKCHVWQHGGCMGLTDEARLPDEYYCEQCKPQYHKILKGANGMRSSRYLPVLEPSPVRSSPPSSDDVPRKGNSKNRISESTKRRATMNSRGAYDDDEMLRRAIEASKETGTSSLGKRTREDADDQKSVIKRQRTGSSASSAESKHSQSPQPANEDAARSVNGSKSTSKLRGAAAKNSREKEMRDKMKEQIAQQRAEAANKRHARSERRRGDDSPPPTPSLSPSKLAQNNTSASKQKAETPPMTKASLSRKGGRPPARRGRLGRNQYTRDLPVNGETSDSPNREMSRDPNGMDSPRPHTNGLGRNENINGESGKSSKAKTHHARTSLNEMKRRVAAILEFVGHMQSERGPTTSHPQTKGTNSNNEDGSRESGSGSGSSLKGSSTPHGTGLTASNLPTAKLVRAVTAGLEEANELKKSVTGDGISKLSADEGGTTNHDSGDISTINVEVPIMEVKVEKEFEEMNSMEMMENLTKELVTWQSLYGIYAR